MFKQKSAVLVAVSALFSLNAYSAPITSFNHDREITQQNGNDSFRTYTRVSSPSEIGTTAFSRQSASATVAANGKSIALAESSAFCGKESVGTNSAGMTEIKSCRFQSDTEASVLQTVTIRRNAGIEDVPFTVPYEYQMFGSSNGLNAISSVSGFARISNQNGVLFNGSTTVNGGVRVQGTRDSMANSIPDSASSNQSGSFSGVLRGGFSEHSFIFHIFTEVALIVNSDVLSSASASGRAWFDPVVNIDANFANDFSIDYGEAYMLTDNITLGDASEVSAPGLLAFLLPAGWFMRRQWRQSANDPKARLVTG